MIPTEIIIRKPSNEGVEYYRTWNLPSKEYPYYCIGYNEHTRRLYVMFTGVDHFHVCRSGEIRLASMGK